MDRELAHPRVDRELRHPRMDLVDRAKIFIPFDPLKGFREALEERERSAFFVSPPDLPEDMHDELSYKLSQLQLGQYVHLKYYSEGNYKHIEGEIDALDTDKCFLVAAYQNIYFESIVSLDI